MLKHTPLYNNHVALGARMVPFAGWEMPVSYKSIIEEHNSVRNSVGIFDVGHMKLIKVSGDHALDLIQKTMTNDASKLEVSQCQYTVLCNDAGGVVDDLFLYKLPMSFLIVANASNGEKVLAWLRRKAKMYGDVVVSPYENYCILSLQGPEAEKLASQALSVDLGQLGHHRSLWWRDIIIARSGYTGEDGFELIVSNNEVVKIWELLLTSGANPCGLGARDTLRLEAGFPLYGHEYNEETSPLEAGYGWAVKFDKDNFVGKTALLEQKEKGVPKKLVGLAPQGRAIPRAGDVVFDKNQVNVLGTVTSGTFSPTLKKPIALAFLATEAADSGSDVNIQIRGNQVPAKIVAKSFYKR